MGSDTRIQKSRWWASMIEKYGSEEAVREVMRQNANKSAKNTGGGGFAYMKKHDPIRLRQTSSVGGKNRRGYRKEYESEIRQS